VKAYAWTVLIVRELKILVHKVFLALVAHSFYDISAREIQAQFLFLFFSNGNGNHTAIANHYYSKCRILDFFLSALIK